MMDFLNAAEPGIAPADLLTGLVYAILKILAYGAIGVVIIGFVTTCCCCLFECHKLKRGRGPADLWRSSF